MNKNYFIVAGVFVALGIFLAFTSVKTGITTETSPDLLHRAIIENTRYLTVEEVTHSLVTKDPSMVLIDLRTVAEFEKFSLPGAINIPFDSLLSASNQDYLSQNVNKSVFYGNGTSMADAAWIICKRKGYTNNFVMQGGLNLWVEQILQPDLSNEVFDKKRLELIQFRTAASQHFLGGSNTVSGGSEKSDAPKGPTVKTKKKEVSGGCG